MAPPTRMPKLPSFVSPNTTVRAIAVTVTRKSIHRVVSSAPKTIVRTSSQTTCPSGALHALRVRMTGLLSVRQRQVLDVIDVAVPFRFIPEADAIHIAMVKPQGSVVDVITFLGSASGCASDSRASFPCQWGR